MSLVGDIILGFRDLAPDPCQTLQSPTTTGATAVPAVGGYFSGGSTVYFVATQETLWGETLPSIEGNVTNVSSFNLQVTINTSYLATGVKLYFTTVGPGVEDQYVEQLIITPASSQTITISALSFPSQSIPPIVSRAWLPDSDGNILSVTRLYSWINEGLKMVGQLTGGVKDITGIPSTFGQAQYQMVHLWQKIDNNFYDGYPVAAGTKQQVFRHSSVTGLSGVTVVNTSANRQLIELWPQSQRTSGQAVLSSPALATDTTLNVTYGANGFVLPFGLILVGTYPPTATYGDGSCELIYYSNLGGSSISQLTRGMGGTQPQAWPVNTPVYECNIYMTGLRQPQQYQRGQSAFVFTCPPAFEDAIRQYLLYRFRDAEQNTEEAESKFKLFKAICEGINKINQPNGPRQVQIGGSGGVEIAIGLGSPFGGVILP